MRLSGILAALACLSGMSLRADSETEVFRDAFDTPALFAEHFKAGNVANWLVEDGVLTAQGDGTNFATLNLPLDVDCKVEADVALLPGTDGCFAGLNLNGSLFLIRPEGFWNVYRNEGDERSSGNLVKKDIEPGKLYRLEITRREIDGGWFFSWAVDGESLGDFSQMSQNKDPGHLSLTTSRAGARFDNVAVYRVEEGQVSNNTLRNSSFEYTQDGLPLYWKAFDQDNVIQRYKTHENFWKVFRLDSENPHSGRQSLRIETNEDAPKIGFQSHNTAVVKGAPFTYSVWLKADRESVPGEMTLWEVFGKSHSQKIVIGTEWKKYSFTISNPEKALVRGGVNIEVPAVVWADDAQVEAGTATGEYEPSPADDRLAAAEKKEPELIQSYTISEGTPKLDEEIAEDWPGALTLEDFRIVETHAKPKEKTSARLFADKENFYITFACFTKHMETLQAEEAGEGMLGKIAGGDCIEVFFDPTGDKRDYYHLFVNPDGGKQAVDPKQKIGWNPAWEVKTAKQADRWDVAIKIPFKSLDAAGSRWGINLARHNPHTQEDSCTSLVGVKQFGDVARYDEFIFPAVADFPSPAKSDAKQSAEPAVYTERNYYMNEPEVVVVADLPASDVTLRLKSEDGKTVWTKAEKAQAGKNRFTIPLKGLAAGNYLVDLGGGKTAPLVKRPFQANATQIDQVRRCLLVNGKPYFAFAPLIGSMMGNDPAKAAEGQKTILKYLADAGFSTVSVVSAMNSDRSPEYWKPLLDYSAELGVKVLAWPAGFTRDYFTPERYSTLVNAIKDHPALLAWCVVDEPELYATPEQVIKVHADFRKLDPYHPIIMNNTYMGIPARFAGLDTDILSFDEYITNREGRGVGEILENVTKMNAVSLETRKPSLMFLSGVNSHNHYREPTAGEQVAQTYGSVIEGVCGTWYFLGVPTARKHWEAYQQTNKELLSLNDVLFSSEETTPISSDQSTVIAMTRKHSGKIYLITANIENKPVSAGFRLPSNLKAVEVLFENRKAEVKNGVLRDNYEPHSRHVYVFEAQD